ncbi:beta-lactamase family protein [Aquimarina sp. D1M17]|uniref:serine hydrolase domain-containing protein n=1 Tax=Aquimarina acroporae TaxID=2937283 RepID=UPI0020BD4B19|nr:serine hydrolase domain-containing protein [Aquimarina acroporae]MCK8521557.1 beta-lactamase family protein [Aquimarina acroporae]
MKKIVVAAFAFVVLTSVLASFNSTKVERYDNAGSLSEKIETHIKRYIENDDYQGAVLIAKDGKILFSKAYGMADREQKIENTTKTPFLIGSLTKSFVAVTVMQLVETGTLDLHAPIRTYIPELKEELGKELTLHILLKHQSGLAQHLERITNFEDKDVSAKEIIDIINTSSLSFTPSSQYQYSNLNYTLSAIAIEKVTGKSYAQVLQEKTFTPLGMSLSGVERKSNYLQNRAKGYRKGTFGIKNDENIVSYALGSGDIFSTVEDLYQWDQALYNNKLLTEKSKALLFDGESYELGSYGYGFRIMDYQRGKGNTKNGILMRHGGTMNGFMSNLHRYSNDKLTVIILGNMRTFPIRKMTRELKEIALNIKPEDRINAKLE